MGVGDGGYLNDFYFMVIFPCLNIFLKDNSYCFYGKMLFLKNKQRGKEGGKEGRKDS